MFLDKWDNSNDLIAVDWLAIVTSVAAQLIFKRSEHSKHSFYDTG